MFVVDVAGGLLANDTDIDGTTLTVTAPSSTTASGRWLKKR